MVAYNAHVGDVHWRQLSMLRQFKAVFVYLGGYLDEQIPDTLDLVQNMVFGRASLREMLSCGLRPGSVDIMRCPETWIELRRRT